MSTPKRIAVVGAGLAAVSACDALRGHGWDGDLVLISAEHELPYERPPLSKSVLMGAAPEDILLRPPQWYTSRNVALHLGVPVTAIRPDLGGVDLANGTHIAADRVLLATGGTPRTLPVPGGADHAHVLRTWRDAETLRRRLLPGARVAVVGAGLIGAETAAAARALGCEVTLVDPVPLPLAATVGDDIARALRRQHTDNGVRLVVGTVSHIGPDGVHVDDNGRTTAVAADTVVVGIGIRPEVSLAENAGLRVDNGIVVTAEGRTSHPHVHAAGDVARRDGDPVRHEHWQAARVSGEAAAAGLLGLPAPPPPVPWFWSDRHGSRLEVAGSLRDADHVVLRGTPDGPCTAFGLRDGTLVAAAAVDRSADITVAQRLIARRVLVTADALADPATDLRKLVRAVRS